MNEENNKKGKKKATKPDIAEKKFVQYQDVFADIINTIVYDGERIVRPENLMPGQTGSVINNNEGEEEERFRDVAKYNMVDGKVYALFGMENQSYISNIMPYRVMQYDWAEMEAQIERFKTENTEKKHKPRLTLEIWPDQKMSAIITLVLYFGMKRWNGPMGTHDMMRTLTEQEKLFIPDYKINLVPVAFLEDDVIEKFQSDFKFVAKFLKAKRLGKLQELEYNNDTWNHVAEVMDLLYTFTGDARYCEEKHEMIEKSQEGVVSMCTLMDLSEARGVAKGEARGEAKGETRKAREVSLVLRKEGWDLEKIASTVNYSVDIVKEWIGQ